MTTAILGAFRLNTDGTVTQALADSMSSGHKATGTEKLATRFLSFLLTEKGSVPYLTTRGSGFLTKLKYGGIATERDVFVAFAAAQSDIVPQLRAIEEDADPDTEKFSKAALLNLVVRFGAVDMTIQLTSKAATTAVIKWPLEFKLQ